MSWLEIIVLAVVQGLTEFLPVSSSGHLVVANALFESLGWPKAEDLLEVNIVLHLGTLLSVLVFYHRAIARLVSQDRRVIPLLLVGTLPAATVGIALKLMFGHVLESALVAGCMFPVTAALLWWAARRPPGDTPYQQLSFRAALGIGCLQAIALLPGISRSGATIVGGLAAGLDRRSAGTFAFLLAIPAIGGAGLIEVLKLMKQSMDPSTAATMATPTLLLVVGCAVSFLVGLAALSLLVRWIERGRLGVFVWYLLPLGVIVVAWQLSIR